MAAVGPHQVIAVVRTKTGAEWLQRLAAREVSEVVFGPRERVCCPICCPALVPCANLARTSVLSIAQQRRPRRRETWPPLSHFSLPLLPLPRHLPLRDPATQSFSQQPEAVHQLKAKTRLPRAGTECRAVHHLVFSISCRAHLHPSFTRPIDDSIRHMVHASDSVEPPA